MAMTHDYLDYLDDQITISPANSQEELQAAQTITELMRQHGLEPEVEEFETKAFVKLGPALQPILMLLGIILVALQGPLHIVGLLLIFVPVAILVARHMGHDVFEMVGPSAASQNVVAHHVASGELVAKGTRPIVIVAHYDAPHESVLRTTAVGPYIPLIRKFSPYFFIAFAVSGLVQLLAFLPEPMRSFFWVVGLVAVIPLVVLGVGTIGEHYAPCTLGANDNKTGFAALLGVMEKVRPTGIVPVCTHRKAIAAASAVPESEPTPEVVDGGEEPAAETATDMEPLSDDVTEVVVEAEPEPMIEPEPIVETTQVVNTEEVVGVRHGQETLESLGILPATCEVEYIAPKQTVTTVTVTKPAPVAAAAATTVRSFRASAATEEAYEDDFLSEEPSRSAAEVGSKAADAVKGFASKVKNFFATKKAEYEASKAAREEAAATEVPNIEPETLTVPDMSAVAAPDDWTDADVTASTEPIEDSEPAATDTEVTGEISGTAPIPVPDASATAAFQFDMGDEPDDDTLPEKDSTGLLADTDFVDDEPRDPEPYERPSDPTDPNWGRSTFKPQVNSVARRASLFDLPDPSELSDPFGASDPDATTVAPATPDTATVPPEGRFKIIGGTKHTSGDGWKGGAATRSGLRMLDEASDDAQAEDGETAPTEADLRDAILSMSDDELIRHDIWFVALGASDLDHAGMKAFLAKHRSNIRGAFLVNLDSIGAGSLTALTSEGFENGRRADRRLSRLLNGVANDLHIPLATAPFDWTDTDATPAMRRSVRSVTIAGLDDSGMPALSHTANDVMDNVNADQVADVTALLTEMIRRA